MTEGQTVSARLLLETAIRVLGLWFVFTAISSLAAEAYLWLPGPPGPVAPDLMIASVIPGVVRGLLGVMLTWWAPSAAAWFYPADSKDAQIHLNVGPGDIYRVACFVLGAYLLVRTAEPASRLVVLLIQETPRTWRSGRAVAHAVVALVYMAAGVLLVFGSRRIGELLSHLRYDPDTIPQQQISLAMLLSLILLLGLILGVIRWLIAGGS